MTTKFVRIFLSLGMVSVFAAAFTSCESTQVGNWDGSGLDSGLSNLPQARHEAWETNARFGNLPQSR
ncbi:MAG: hypothetical protein MK183_05755 [Verrucomicrobiales bacterium]|nr:hypothetical protein [Verrucomicrobiales bacterium]MED5585213.1 hypothetical protein [Verrucomicrobiota bacterium]